LHNILCPSNEAGLTQYTAQHIEYSVGSIEQYSFRYSLSAEL